MGGWFRGEQTKMTGLADGVMHRTLVYVEGDASMRQFENREGKMDTALNIVQSGCNTSRLNLDTTANSGYANVERLEILDRRGGESPSAEERLVQE